MAPNVAVRTWSLPFGIAPTQLIGVVAALALVLVPLFVDSQFQLLRLEIVMFSLLSALSLNFAFGYAGQLALGQPVMVATAAYTTGVLSVQFGWSWTQTLPAAILGAVVVNLVLAIPSIRVRGWYLAIISFFAIGIIPDIVLALSTYTGGTDGLIGIKPIEFGGVPADGWIVYEMVAVGVILCTAAIAMLARSGWGVALLATRYHPIAAAASGIDLRVMRVRVYTLSAIPCGIAGWLLAHSQQFISVDNFGLNSVLLIIGSVFLGGPGTVWGPVLGVGLFQGLSLYLGPFSPYNALFLGLGVLASALFFRRGIVPALSGLVTRIRRDSVTRMRIGAPTEPASIASVETPPQLTVRNVAKHFEGNKVLRDVNLDIRGGRVLAVVGPNGSGKTTLLNVIGGFVAPDTGQVNINGQNITRRPSHELAAHGIGRTFQVPKLIESLSVARNIELGVVGKHLPSLFLTLFGLPGARSGERKQRTIALEAARAVGFSEGLAQVVVATLPLGLKRLVEIARALAGDASVICLDEPVAGLSEEERKQVGAVIRLLAESGRAVLLIEHNLAFVLSVCDDVLLLVEGAVADSGVPNVVTDRARPLGKYFQTFAGAEQVVTSVPQEIGIVD